MLVDDQRRCFERRFGERGPRRSLRLRALEAVLRGDVVEPDLVEPMSRTRERARLLGHEIDPASSPAVARLVLESVVGVDDRLPRRFLADALQRSGAVCRLVGIDTEFQPSYGTGFCIAPGWLLTNNHVVPTVGVADRTIAEFGYWDAGGSTQPIRVRLEPSAGFLTSVDLDYTLVSLDPAVAMPLHDLFGSIELLPASGKALVGEPVNIVSHGDAAPQQFSIRSNRVVDVFDHWVHYTTDTSPGSSGAPVLNDQWQLVALHHASTTQVTDGGRRVTVNEGARISSVAADIASRV